MAEVNIKTAEALGRATVPLVIGSIATAVMWNTKHRAFVLGATIGSAYSAYQNDRGIAYSITDRVVYGLAGGFLFQAIGRKLSLNGGSFEGFGNVYCRECAKYPNNGLRHSLKKLEEVFPKIGMMPIKEQAKYADRVTEDNVNNPELIQQFMETAGIINPAVYNTTAIGNMAYIALHSKFPVARQYAAGMLELYKKHKTGKL